MSNELAKSLSVPAIAAACEQAERDIVDGFALVARAELRLNQVFLPGTELRVRPLYHRDFDFADPEGPIVMLRRQLWRLIVDRIEIRRLMSVRAWNELEKQILDGEDVPPITVETVTQLGVQFESQLDSMLEEAVREVFEWLRPPNSEYKTNSEFEVGKRVILRYVVHPAWHGHGFRVDYDRRQKLTALENVFTALDGKGSINKRHTSAIEEAIEKCESGRGATEYFKFRCFLNRNLHLEFLRPDLLKRLNAIAGGARLRGERK